MVATPRTITATSMTTTSSFFIVPSLRVSAGSWVPCTKKMATRGGPLVAVGSPVAAFCELVSVRRIHRPHLVPSSGGSEQNLPVLASDTTGRMSNESMSTCLSEVCVNPTIVATRQGGVPDANAARSAARRTTTTRPVPSGWAAARLGVPSMRRRATEVLQRRAKASPRRGPVTKRRVQRARERQVWRAEWPCRGRSSAPAVALVVFTQRDCRTLLRGRSTRCVVVPESRL